MKQEELEAKLKKLQDSDSLYKKKKQIITSNLSKYGKLVYVDPLTFRGLVGNKKNKIVDHDYVEKQLDKSDACFVYTNHVKAPHFDGQYIEFDREIAMQIKHVEWSFLDKLFTGNTEAPYNKKLGKLYIEEAEFKFNKDKEPARICNLLFGSAQYVKKVRQWDEILEKVLDRNRDRDHVNSIKMKVYRINERIDEELGYPEMIKFENKTLFVNPDYYYLFKTIPNETE